MGNNVLELFEVTTIEVESSKLHNEDIRFNADYFLLSKNILFKSNLEFKPLSEFAQVIFPGIFKRILVDNSQFGIPFITTSEMMENAPKPEKYLSKDLTKNINIYRVEEDWILVSRSGTIGNTIFTSKIQVPFAITEDALRVIPFEKNNVGFLYFYISSKYCNDLIVGKKGGAVVDHIYEEDLMRLQVPIVPEKIKEGLNLKYFKVKNLREGANELLILANNLVFEYSNLPELKISIADIIDKKQSIQSRILKSCSINGDYRLDAHFYNPITELLINNITSKSKEYTNLSKMASKLFYLNRFTRTFVKKEYGIPYLAGKDIIKIRPDNLNYLSESETKGLDAYKLQKGWILVTCSGTIGRSCLIWENYENYVGTHDLIRIELKDGHDFGYVYSFLNTAYGINQILKFKHGAVIDHITPEQIGEVIIPIISFEKQKEIGDIVRLAYEKRAEALKLEDEAQELLKEALTNN